MKRLITHSVFIFLTVCGFGQDYKKIDSLLKILALTKTDTGRVWAMHDLAYNYLYSKPDSSIWYAQNALTLSKKIGYGRGEVRSMNDIANALTSTGNYSLSIKMFLEALQKSEDLNDENMKATSLGNISEAYNDQGDFRQAINYTLRSLAIDLAHHDTLYMIYDYLNLGEYYAKANLLDSSLQFGNQAYQLALQVNNTEQMGGIVYVLGNVHSGLGNDDLALPFYRKSVLLNQATGNKAFVARTFYLLAQHYKRFDRTDSVFIYLGKAYNMAFQASEQKTMLDATSMLASLYEHKNNDSTLKYLKLSVAIKDSMFNQEKIKQVQNLTINEQLRQAEIAQLESKAEKDRVNNLQLMGIAAFLPIFFGIVMLLSRKKAKPRTIEFMGLLGLLLLFEFISLFIHPYIAEWTHHSPLLMLLILVAIAALLVPLQHRLEKFIINKLAHKNPTVAVEMQPASKDAVADESLI